MKKNNTIVPSISLLLAGFGYALYGPLSRIVGAGFGPVGQTFTRAVFRLAIMAAIFILLRVKLKKISRHDLIWMFMISAVAAATTLFYIQAIINLPFGLTMFLFYALGTISSYATGYFLFGEKLNRGKAVALLMVVAGLLLMFVESIHLVGSLFLAFACASGFFYGLYSPFSKKVSHKYPLTQSIGVTVAFEIVIYSVAWLVFRDRIPVTAARPWVANFVYAGDVIVITYLVFYGFKHLEAQIGSLLLLSEVVFILILGLVFYHEVPTLLQMVGGLAILSGMLAPQFIKD